MLVLIIEAPTVEDRKATTYKLRRVCARLTLGLLLGFLNRRRCDSWGSAELGAGSIMASCPLPFYSKLIESAVGSVRLTVLANTKDYCKYRKALLCPY